MPNWSDTINAWRISDSVTPMMRRTRFRSNRLEPSGWPGKFMREFNGILSCEMTVRCRSRDLIRSSGYGDLILGMRLVTDAARHCVLGGVMDRDEFTRAPSLKDGKRPGGLNMRAWSTRMKRRHRDRGDVDYCLFDPGYADYSLLPASYCAGCVIVFALSVTAVPAYSRPLIDAPVFIAIEV